MKQNHTDITIVLDRSGSMSAVASDTIGGFNRFLDDQRKAPGTATVTLYQFNHIVCATIHAKDISQAPPLTPATFCPDGYTALLDAIGMAMEDTGRRLALLPEGERAAKVVFVIVTDGIENASKLFAWDKIQGMIQHQRDAYKWEFVFLGANQDAIKTAAGLGVKGDNAMTYAHNSAGTSSAFASTSANLVRMRSGASVSMAYTADDRAEQEAAGANATLTPNAKPTP